jgi:hypothetical protein
MSDGPDLIHTQRAVGYSLRLPRPGEVDPGEFGYRDPASAGQAEASAHDLGQPR